VGEILKRERDNDASESALVGWDGLFQLKRCKTTGGNKSYWTWPLLSCWLARSREPTMPYADIGNQSIVCRA
jgi:hypothetical protein